MPTPLKGVLTLCATFLILLAFSFVLSVIFKRKNQNDKVVGQPQKNASKQQNGEKIYYIENYKRPPKRRRKPSVALKSTIISPEEFKRKNGDF